MAQSGYTPILIYGSGTAGNTPSASNLTSSSSGAELALNYADGKLFYKNSSGVVSVLASSAALTGIFYGLETSTISTPATPTATGSSTGGSLIASTYYFKIVAVDNLGATTLPSSESTVVTTTGSTSSIAIAWTATTGAKSYQVWYSTTTGTQANYFTTTANSYSFTTTAGSTAGTIPSTNTTGNLLFVGTGQRITGDFSNATQANRVAFQTSTTNGNSTLTVLPNGTGSQTTINFFDNSDPTNAGTLNLVSSNTEKSIRAAITGSGTYLPMTFYTGGSERARIDTSGNIIAGSGEASASPAGNIIRAPNAAGTNIAGANLAMYAGNGTGTGGSGYIDFQVAPAGSTGSSADTLASAMRISNAGSVGIGTTSPGTFKLAVVGGRIQLSGGTSSQEGVAIQRASGYASITGINNDNNAYNALAFYTSATEAMRITTAGGISFGSTGTAYGTSGQLLSSAGNASPTWINQSSITVGTATTATNATNVAVTDDTSTSSSVYPTWVTATSGNAPEKVSSTKLTFTPSSGILSSNSGSIPSDLIYVANSDNGLASQTAAQRMFFVGTHGGITLPVIGTYQFECQFTLTNMSTVSGTFGFALTNTDPATATFTQFWVAEATKVAFATATAPVRTWNTAANTALIANTTSANGTCFIRGIINCTATGYIIPSISLSIAAAAILKAGSYFKISLISTASGSTDVQVGSWV